MEPGGAEISKLAASLPSDVKESCQETCDEWSDEEISSPLSSDANSSNGGRSLSKRFFAADYLLNLNADYGAGRIAPDGQRSVFPSQNHSSSARPSPVRGNASVSPETQNRSHCVQEKASQDKNASPSTLKSNA